MYSNHHGTAGAAIVLATDMAGSDAAFAAIVGGGLATVSPHFLDTLGENGYGGTKCD